MWRGGLALLNVIIISESTKVRKDAFAISIFRRMYCLAQLFLPKHPSLTIKHFSIIVNIQINNY